MKTWHDKAKEIVGALSLQAYRQANPAGKYKRHRPYSVPLLAESLVQALNRDDEHEAKRLMECYRLGVHPESELCG